MRPRRARQLDRLTDANPRWIVHRPGTVHGCFELAEQPGDTVVGIYFSCPIHDDCRILVHFEPTFGAPGPTAAGALLWTRHGTTFEALTLSPSIRILGEADGCEWHGFVTDGRLVTLDDSR